MIATCMRENNCFGVVLVHKGEETLANADIYTIGTTATISDWEHRSDGLLGITALGVERFQIVSTNTQADGLTLAEIEILQEQSDEEIPGQYHYMFELLDHIRAQEGGEQDEVPNFASVLYQLIYLLPLEPKLKQRLLEVPESSDRAVILHAELIRLGVIQYIKPEARNE